MLKVEDEANACRSLPETATTLVAGAGLALTFIVAHNCESCLLVLLLRSRLQHGFHQQQASVVLAKPSSPTHYRIEDIE